MKTENSDQAHQARLSEGMRLIFDQRSTTSSSRSSSRDSSYSSNQSRCSSYGSQGSRRRRHQGKSPSSSSSGSSSESRSRSRSRSHPRCHRDSDRSRCRHRHHTPPRRYRARSRSFSRGRKYRAYSRSSSRSSLRERYSRRWCRSRSRSSSYRGFSSRFAGRYTCRFSPSPRRRYRDNRRRSRSLERSAVRLSQKEKLDLLNIAKENATKILGVQNLELPASVKSLEQNQKQQESSNAEEQVRTDTKQSKKRQDKCMKSDDVAKTSPTRKPITFSINNTVAKPSSSPTFHVTETKVTSRADSVGNRKPYGQWVPIKKFSPIKH